MAARYWNKQNASANWNATAPTNWGSSSGTADSASVPGVSDDVTFDGAGTGGNANSTNSASISILSLTFTSGYTATITNNNILTIGSGGLTDNTAHSWSGTQSLQLTTCTVNSGGKTYSGSVLVSGGTVTLGADWTIVGTLNANSTTATINGAFNLNCASVTSTANIAGSATVVMSGGTWSGVGSVACNLTISGTSTMSGTLSYLTNTLTITSGTITSPTNLQVTGTATLNTPAVTFTLVTLTSATPTITLNGSLLATTLTLNAGVAATFAGTSGFTVGTLNVNSTDARTVTFKNGITYTITASFQAFTSRTGSIVTFTSDHATNKAILTLNAGATCSVLANATRIDSSAGRTINTFRGTLTTCTNWFSYTDYGGGVSGSYVWC